MIRRVAPLLATLALLGAERANATPPVAELHQLEWFVHVDLIDAGAGQDLAYWQARIDDASASASDLLIGGQGPYDSPCCNRVGRSVAVTTFGSAGDGLVVLDSASEYATIAAIGLPGSQAFLVQGIDHCGGPAPGALGCAETPPCDSDPNDDPDLWLVATVDALDSDLLGNVLAHERAHNACLDHVDLDECQLMRAAAGGGCVDTFECEDLSDGRTTSGGVCDCHVDGVGGIESDGTTCDEGGSLGLCSGGVCGDPSGPANVALLCSAGPESADGETTDDALRMSGAGGDWSLLGPLSGSGDVVSGLAYAHDSGVLYGLVPTSGDDRLVTLDPDSGAITGTVGTIANGTLEFVALAYDPGATSSPSDDRLLALESDGTFEDLYEIDPSSPSSPVSIGPLAFGGSDGFRGLAYDSSTGKLYTASPFAAGIYEIDLPSCSSQCALTGQPGNGLPRRDASLAYSRESARLHLFGTQSPFAPLGRRALYTIVDPVTWERSETIGVDAVTPSGLAALPEPGAGLALAAGAALLFALRARHRRGTR